MVKNLEGTLCNVEAYTRVQSLHSHCRCFVEEQLMKEEGIVDKDSTTFALMVLERRHISVIF